MSIPDLSQGGPVAEIAVLLANRDLIHQHRYLGVPKGQVPQDIAALLALATRKATEWTAEGFTPAEVSEWIEAECHEPTSAKYLQGLGVSALEAQYPTPRGYDSVPDSIGAKVSRGSLPDGFIQEIVGWHRKNPVSPQAVFDQVVHQIGGVVDEACREESAEWLHRDTVRRHAHEPYVLFAGKTGYSPVILFAADSPALPLAGEKVTGGIGSGLTRQQVVASAQKMVESMLKTDKNERFAYFDGLNVREISRQEVSGVVRTHIAQVKAAWTQQAAVAEKPVEAEGVAAYWPGAGATTETLTDGPQPQA